MDGLEIRPMVRSDLDVLFLERSRPFGEAWLAAQEQGDVSVAVAVLDGRPVARVTLLFKGYGERACLDAGTVLPELRSRGIGSRLLEHVEELARRRGRKQIVFAVAKGNLRAQRLYERYGYVRCGEKVARWTWVENGQTVDVAVDVWKMQKDI
jgi:ribosomal protein S18 acetylase RimI-like enzyme